MQKQNTNHRPEAFRSFFKNLKLKTENHLLKAPDHDLPRVSSKYERHHFYERRMHNPDGPGGSYEGL